jgi:molecular chaperone DnaK
VSKEFLKLGIDHGTSNSSICVMESSGPRVIRVNGVDEIMPSVVYIDKRGRTIVGSPAYRAMMFNPPDEGDGYTGYKIRIGQDDRYDFGASKKSLTAPQLGGLVMGALLRAYRDETGEEPVGAVITVPAKFEHSACEGTREAAKAAGLKLFPQIQEPVAASMAYGFTATDRRAQWMVFDLGGGTLDVSMVLVRQGRMDVPEEGHAGDNRLGGREFDREIMAYVLAELRKKYALAHFSEGNPQYRQAWGRLMIACEQAKIQLSTKPEATVELDAVLCKDEKGQDVQVEVPVARTAYEQMIAPKIQKALLICRNLLEKNRLSPKDLDRLILIGGPTKTPYVQQCLAEGLGIEVGTSIDPMTAVAMGAALHAATVEVPDEFRTVVPVSETIAASFVQVQLEYERTPRTSPCFVAGRVLGDIGGFNGFSVEVRRADGWSTGLVPLAEDGTFECDVALVDEGAPKLSSFETRVVGKTGEVVATTAEPQIFYPYTEVEGRLANSLLIATQNNQTVNLARKGVGLPAKGSESFVTTKALRKGSGEDVLHIPVLEGVSNLFGEENVDADCSVHIGSLVIKGDDEKLKYDLPEGSKLRVTVHQDASREVRCVAYVDLLDEEFEGVVNKEGFAIEAKDVEARFAVAKSMLEEAETLQREIATAGVDEKLKTIRDLRIMEEIAKEIERAGLGERDALYRAYRRVLELAGGLKMLAEAQTEARIRRRISRLKKAVQGDEAKDLNSVEQEFEVSAGDRDRIAFARVEQSLEELDVRVRQRPYNDVLLDLIALNNVMMPPHQIAVFKAGDELLARIEKKGGVNSLTADDLRELEAMHRKFAETFTDLFERRQKALEDMGGRIIDAARQGLRSDVKKAETAHNY